VSSAGTTFRLNSAQIETLIRDAGYEPGGGIIGTALLN